MSSRDWPTVSEASANALRLSAALVVVSLILSNCPAIVFNGGLVDVAAVLRSFVAIETTATAAPAAMAEPASIAQPFGPVNAAATAAAFA